MIKSKIPHSSVLVLAAAGCALLLGPAATALTGFEAPAEIAYAAFSRVCHQDPGRSFHLFGAALPVCARCTGLHLGFLAGWAGLLLLGPARRNRPVSNLGLALCLLPLAIDGTLNLSGLIVTPAAVRFMTGVLFGAGAARALGPALREALAIAAPHRGRAFSER